MASPVAFVLSPAKQANDRPSVEVADARAVGAKDKHAHREHPKAENWQKSEEAAPDRPDANDYSHGAIAWQVDGIPAQSKSFSRVLHGRSGEEYTAATLTVGASPRRGNWQRQMLGISWPELLTIAVVALVVVGPKDLPYAMRFVGNWVGRLRRMSREFQGQFREALREAELDSVRQDLEAVGKTGSLAEAERQLKQADADVRRKTVVDKPVGSGASGA